MTDREGRWQPIVAEDDIPAGGLAFTCRSGPFPETGILIRTPGGLRAWRNRCRHLAVPLDHADPGRFLASDGRHLVCSQHGALYRLHDGLCVAGPCAGAGLRPLQVVVRHGVVFLDLDSVPDPLAGRQPAP